MLSVGGEIATNSTDSTAEYERIACFAGTVDDYLHVKGLGLMFDATCLVCAPSHVAHGADDPRSDSNSGPQGQTFRNCSGTEGDRPALRVENFRTTWFIRRLDLAGTPWCLEILHIRFTSASGDPGRNLDFPSAHVPSVSGPESPPLLEKCPPAEGLAPED